MKISQMETSKHATRDWNGSSLPYGHVAEGMRAKYAKSTTTKVRTAAMQREYLASILMAFLGRFLFLGLLIFLFFIPRQGCTSQLRRKIA